MDVYNAFAGFHFGTSKTMDVYNAFGGFNLGASKTMDVYNAFAGFNFGKAVSKKGRAPTLCRQRRPCRDVEHAHFFVQASAGNKVLNI